MILKELQEKCDWDSVSGKLTELYPDQVDNLQNYCEAWHEMRSLTPVPSSMMITIGEHHNEQTGKSTYSVSGDAPLMAFVVADSVKNPFRRVWGRIANFLKLKFLSRRWRRR
jgi:hypothetical protein